MGQIRQRNEAQIVAAAIEVFSARGLEAATTAEIADRAGLPKANLHYYYRTKLKLYQAVIAHIISSWDQSLDHFTDDADPVTAITAYIRDKIAYSRNNPIASRLFAREIIDGAEHIRHYLIGTSRPLLQAKSAILSRWAERGLIDPIPPAHFFFLIWAATQTYADFGPQIWILMGLSEPEPAEFDHAADFITQLVLKGIGARAA